jgi:hypothetical protein
MALDVGPGGLFQRQSPRGGQSDLPDRGIEVPANTVPMLSWPVYSGTLSVTASRPPEQSEQLFRVPRSTGEYGKF